jgi:thiol peroxidase
MAIERRGVYTKKGTPLTVIGPVLKVGDKAPDFTLQAAPDLSDVTLDDSAGKVRLLNVVPSLDTSVCAQQTRRFNEEATRFSPDVVVLTVSVDLPYAQRRFAQEAGADRVQFLSDHRDMNFGNAYGTHVKELRQEQRSVFVVDRNGLIRYVEYVPEDSQHPDYEGALNAVRQVAG